MYLKNQTDGIDITEDNTHSVYFSMGGYLSTIRVFYSNPKTVFMYYNEFSTEWEGISAKMTGNTWGRCPIVIGCAYSYTPYEHYGEPIPDECEFYFGSDHFYIPYISE